MLCLTRKKEQSVLLMLPNGDVITVIVTGITPTSAKLAFSAPREVGIVRAEIVEQRGEAA